MTLRNSERRIKLLNGFIKLWEKFHDVLKWVSKEKDITDESEQSFLKLKTEIAYQQARLSEIFQLKNRFTDEIMSILSQVTSLNNYRTMSSLQIRRIEAQWNNLFMLMHAQLGKDEVLFERKWFLHWIKNPWLILGIVAGGFFFIFYFLR